MKYDELQEALKVAIDTDDGTVRGTKVIRELRELCKTARIHYHSDYSYEYIRILNTCFDADRDIGRNNQYTALCKFL